MKKTVELEIRRGKSGMAPWVVLASHFVPKIGERLCMPNMQQPFYRVIDVTWTGDMNKAIVDTKEDPDAPYAAAIDTKEEPMSEMKNKGLHQHRLEDNPEERRFAKAWEKRNNHIAAGFDTIDYLLSPDNNHPVPATEREREIAATVIQWLGSPVGQEFLRERGYRRYRRVVLPE